MPLQRLSDVVNRVAEVHRVPRRSILASVALVSSLGVGLIAALAGFGTRWNFWAFPTGFTLLRISVVLGGITGLLGLVGTWITLPLRSDKRGFTLSLLSLLVSGLVVGLPLQWKYRADRAPMIHDVTTDPQDPPRFRVVGQYRTPDQDDLEFGDDATLEAHRRAYSELGPAVLDADTTTCTRTALEVARQSGWTIHRADWDRGRIEATDTTFWFGFKDDVAVRVEGTEGDRCRLDVRSVSRVGRSDLGTNARRIEKYLRDVRSNVAGVSTRGS